MPPPVPSESSESNYSDSGSVHTIETTHNGANHATDEVVRSVEVEVKNEESSDDDSANSDVYKTDGQQRLVNATKRKEYPDDHVDNHEPPTKTRRQQLDSANSDEAEASDDADDDDDRGPAYIEHSFFAPQPQQPLANGVMNPQLPVQANTPAPITALQLMREMLPHITPQPTNLDNIFSMLAPLPAVRRPDVLVHRFNDSRRQNQAAFIMQAVGEELLPGQACEKCARGSGVLRGACVVVRDTRVLSFTGGACANCWYARQGSLCSFRQNAARDLSTTEEPDSAPAIAPAPAPAPPPAPIHPAYAAAVAAGTVAAPIMSVDANNRSRDETIIWWEARYRSMPLDHLRQAHTHLRDWQEDLSTRLVAMNTVLLERLAKLEGQQ
ncbi:hypothetical protein VTJ49DRAFT_4643 [Mycothermus thermophilus]|uniref:Uncharacterized protein n=1 Tax=Humicola insolens TaxID=85995 RepID=A0ABR3V5Q9_HUMIN